MNRRGGSTLDDFLAEDGILDEASAKAHKRLLVLQLADIMEESKMSKDGLAQRLQISRKQVDRLLDPDNALITPELVQRLAHSVGKEPRTDNLFDEAPDALQFCQAVQEDIGRYRLFDDEQFYELRCSVLSTSGTDTQGEAFTVKALKEGVRKINEHGLRLSVQHDPLIQPYGRFLSAKLCYAPKSDIYFIAAVMGLYDVKSLPKFKDLGVDFAAFITDDDFEVAERRKGHQAQIAFSHHEIDARFVKELLQNAPGIVNPKTVRSLRKEADPIRIFTVLASIWLLASNPLSKKFLERYGEEAANASIAFFSWLSRSVFGKLRELGDRRVLFEFLANYKGCQVEFVVSSTDTAILCEASNSVHAAAQSAVKCIDYLEHAGLQKLVYEFDIKTSKWLPLHAVTKKFGVISDRPYLIAIDQMHGLSVGGMISDGEESDTLDPN